MLELSPKCEGEWVTHLGSVKGTEKKKKRFLRAKWKSRAGWQQNIRLLYGLFQSRHITQFKLALLTTQQASKWRDDLIWKASRMRRWWICVPKSHLTWVRIQTSFILKMRQDVGVCCKFPGAGILCTCNCPGWSDNNLPTNLQQDKYILFLIFYLYEMEKRYTFKGPNYPIYFRLEAIFFYKRCRASMTKHRPRSAKVRAEGIDAIWSQLCSSLLETDALLSYQTRASGRPLTWEWVGNPVLFLKETPRRHSTRLSSSCPLILHTQGLPSRVFTRKAWRTDRSWSLKPWRKLGERFLSR